MPFKIVKPDTLKTKITETVYSLINLRGKNEVDLTWEVITIGEALGI